MRVNSQAYREVEERFGAPMHDVLVVLLTRLPREDVARALGCNTNTVDRWLSANALSFERVPVVKSLQNGATATVPGGRAAAILAEAVPAQAKSEVPA